MMWDIARRTVYMDGFGLDTAERDMLLSYNTPSFRLPPAEAPADEAFVAMWRVAPTHGDGLAMWLNEHFSLPGADFADPDGIMLSIHDGSAGAIPVLSLNTRADFVKLVLGIFAAKGVKSVPDSVGAMAIRGWKDKTGTGHRAILLSRGPYSAIPADAMGMPEAEWLDRSYVIRRNHEYAHYWTLRRLGSMKNCLHDELIADAAGLTAAFGRYDAAYFQRFIGIENYPAFRTGGRLGSYLPREAALSEKGMLCLMTMARDASDNLERALAARPGIAADELIISLAELSIEQIAAGDFEL